jgi:uncharacterized membrane protein (UPF0127 family)
MRHFLVPVLQSPLPHGLMIARTASWLVEEIEAAFESTSRKAGLLGRDDLRPGTGFVLAPSQGIHTFGMRFPLDIVAVDRNGRVVKYRARVAPRRILTAWSAFAIIELAAGTCARAGLVEGDRLLAVPRAARAAHAG